MLSAILLLLSWPSGPVVQIQEVPSKSDCHSSQSPGHSQACGIYLLDSCGSLLTTVRIPHVLLLVIASHLPVILPLDSHTHPSRDIVLPPVLATDIHAESVPPVHKERKESVSTLNGVVSILDPVPQLV